MICSAALSPLRPVPRAARDGRATRVGRVARRRFRPAAVAFGAAALLAATLALAGCAPRKAPPEDSARRAQDLIDAGNTAYRAGDFRLAARRYGAAVVVKNDDPAAYYGLGMALAKLGRDEDARAAYARARDLAQKTQGPP